MGAKHRNIKTTLLLFAAFASSACFVYQQEPDDALGVDGGGAGSGAVDASISDATSTDAGSLVDATDAAAIADPPSDAAPSDAAPTEEPIPGDASPGHGGGPRWRTPELVELDTVHSVFVGRIQADAAGNAIAVWEQHNGAHYDLWAARYRIDQGWGAPELIESFTGGDVHISSLYVAPGGNAIVAWTQETAGVLRIAANTFDIDSGWGLAQLIDIDTGNGQQYPQVALDSTGGAIAVWEEVISTDAGYTFDVWWNRLEPGSGWGTAAYLEAPGAGSVLGETVVPDGQGGLMAIWTHSYGNPNASVWSRRYLPGSGWQAPEVVLAYSSAAPRAYYTPEVAFDSAGRGLLVAQVSGVGVQSIRYEPGPGWGAPTALWPNDGSFVRAPRLAMNTSGQAMAVFVRDAGEGYDLWSRYFDPETGWSAEVLVADEAASLSFIRHDVGIDESGKAIALWARPTSPLGMYSRSFVPGQGWGADELIDTPNTQLPAIAVDRQGNATVLYPNTGTGGYSMWAVRRD